MTLYEVIISEVCVFGVSCTMGLIIMLLMVVLLTVLLLLMLSLLRDFVLMIIESKV